MLHQQVHYEICTEDEDGFTSQTFSCESIAEAQKDIAVFRRRWPRERAFKSLSVIVRGHGFHRPCRIHTR